MIHAMIDIETLGAGIEVPLFEIGVCIFDPNEKRIIDTYQFNVDLLDVIISTGFSTERDTINWWRKQSYDPRTLPRSPLKDSLIELNKVLEKHAVSFVWANSPSFDCVILEQHYKAVGIKKTWSYSKELDLRTIKWIFQTHCGMKLDGRPRVSHNAREDAMHQTELLLGMLPSV